MKKIIFINQYITHLFVDIINDFVDHGVEVEVLTGGIHSAESLSDKVKIRKFISYQRNTTLKRLLTWHIFGIQVFFYLMFKKLPVFACTNPPFLPIIALIYSKLKRSPFHVLFYDLYPNALERMGYIKKSNSIYKLWKAWNKKVLASASEVFAISRGLGKGLSRIHKEKKHIHIISPWTDNEYIKPMDKSVNPFIKKYNLKDKFVILYSGNMGITHDIESVLHSASETMGLEEIKFVLIGDGRKKGWVEKFIDKNKMSNVLTLPWQPVDQLPFTFSSADIGIVTLDKGAEGISVPSKTYAYLAAGVTLLAIADSDSELGNLIKKYQVGAIFNPGDINGISAFIKEMKKKPDQLKKYKENSRKASYKFGKDNAKEFYKIIEFNNQ